MKEEEKILIEQAKHGDKEAFSQLYNKYWRLIRYIIYDAIKDDDITADLLSITFIKAYERLDYFVESISFEAWLKTIAINTVIDYVRKKKREQNNYSIDNEESAIQLPSDNDPEADLIKSESLEIMKIALTRLRSRYRNLLELRYFKGLTYEELSAELNIPIGTIKSDLCKAKRRLRHFFDIISNSYKS
jgi:RNA polymerase sigma-70 factor (ECF subfamily)